MKFFFLIILIYSSSAFPIDPQEHGGGTICYSSKSEKYVVIDETLYALKRQHERVIYEKPFSREYWTNKKLNLLSLHISQPLLDIHLKLTKRFYGRKSLFAAALKIFTSAQIKNNTINISNDYDPKLHRNCEPGTIALAALNDGQSLKLILVNYLLLSNKSRSVLLIHEYFRAIQLLSSEVFISNQDLAKLVMTTYIGDFKFADQVFL